MSVDASGLRDVCEQLRRCPSGLDPVIARLVPNGSAYHHAGKNTPKVSLNFNEHHNNTVFFSQVSRLMSEILLKELLETAFSK